VSLTWIWYCNGFLYYFLLSERTDPSGTVTRTTRVVKTSKQSGSGGQQPFIDDVETFNPTDYSTLQSTAKYSSLKRDDYQTKEKPYTLGKTIRTISNTYPYKYQLKAL